MLPRISPLEPPYEPSTGELLTRMMPPGQPPIRLFRTFVRNPTMTEAMNGWGSYLLSRRFSVSLREREIVIDRVCVRCGCEYEWGVHVAYFAERVGLTPEQITSLTYGGPDDACWIEPHERALIAAVDALHDRAVLDDTQFAAMHARTIMTTPTPPRMRPGMPVSSVPMTMWSMFRASPVSTTISTWTAMKPR